MKPTLSRLLIISFLLLIVNCDRTPCDTKNPIFLAHNYTSNVYQNELAKEIKKTNINNLRYWLADYIQVDEKHYFVFYTQNKDLCAKAIIEVDENDENLSQLIARKGKGKFNAEFKNLQFEITTNESGDTEFIYTSHDRIID